VEAASETVLAATKEVAEPKKDALAEAMEAFGGDIIGDGLDDDKTASNETDATEAEMDGASALAALASAAVAVDVSKKPSNGTSDTSGGDAKSDVDHHGVSAEERRRDANWFDVGIIKGTSCTVSSYYLPSGDQEKTDIDVEREDILKKLDLQVG